MENVIFDFKSRVGDGLRFMKIELSFHILAL